MQVTQTQTATYTVINQVTTTMRLIGTVNKYPRRVYYGTAGDDYITGNLGDDIIQGGDGNDIINGGQGADDISGGYGNDRIWGGIGNDNISGGYGRDVLLGGEGDDRMNGDDGDDYLSGAEGNDTLIGGAGNDVLNGGTGRDVMEGGTGRDLFNVNISSGERCIIIDFNPKEDRLSLDKRAAYSFKRYESDTGFYRTGTELCANGQPVALLAWTYIDTMPANTSFWWVE